MTKSQSAGECNEVAERVARRLMDLSAILSQVKTNAEGIPATLTVFEGSEKVDRSQLDGAISTLISSISAIQQSTDIQYTHALRIRF